MLFQQNNNNKTPKKGACSFKIQNTYQLLTRRKSVTKGGFLYKEWWFLDALESRFQPLRSGFKVHITHTEPSVLGSFFVFFYNLYCPSFPPFNFIQRVTPKNSMFLRVGQLILYAWKSTFQ